MTIYLTPYNALQPTPSHQSNQQPHVHVQIITIRPLCSNFHQMFLLVNMDRVEQNLVVRNVLVVEQSVSALILIVEFVIHVPDVA